MFNFSICIRRNTSRPGWPSAGACRELQVTSNLSPRHWERPKRRASSKLTERKLHAWAAPSIYWTVSLKIHLKCLPFFVGVHCMLLCTGLRIRLLLKAVTEHF